MTALESDERRLLASVAPSSAARIRLATVSTATFVGVASALGVVFGAVTGRSLEPITVAAASPLEGLVGVALVVGLLVLVIVPHELLHGLAMARYGGRPSYGVDVSGFLLPYAYAESSGTTYTRNQMLSILLAPLVGITLLGLAALAVVGSPLLVLPVAANAAGSVGDCWTAARLLRYPASVRVAALPDGRGTGIYGPPGTDAARFPLERELVAFVAGAAGTTTLLVAGLFAFVFASLAFGSGDVVLGEPGRPWFLLRHELDPDGYAVSFEFGGPALVALSTLGGLVRAVAAAGGDGRAGKP